MRLSDPLEHLNIGAISGDCRRWRRRQGSSSRAAQRVPAISRPQGGKKKSSKSRFFLCKIRRALKIHFEPCGISGAAGPEKFGPAVWPSAFSGRRGQRNREKAMQCPTGGACGGACPTGGASMAHRAMPHRGAPPRRAAQGVADRQPSSPAREELDTDRRERVVAAPRCAATSRGPPPVAVISEMFSWDFTRAAR